MWPKTIFSSKYQYKLIIVKQTGIKWGQGQISTTWKEIGLINTKLSKLTNEKCKADRRIHMEVLWVEGSTQSLLYITNAYWQNLKTSVLLDSVIVHSNWICWASKERRNEKLKGQLEKGRLPLLIGHVHHSAWFPTLDVILRVKQKTKKRNYKTSIFETWKILAGLGFDKH